METFTGKQRISAAFRKTFSREDVRIDRIPAYPLTGQVNAQLVGASIRDFVLDTKVFVKAQVAGYERYEPDIVLMQRDLLMEAEALGNELKFPENSLCISKNTALANKARLSSLKVPDPKRDGRLPAYLEAIAETRKVVKNSPVSPVISGPWTIAIALRDAATLIKDALKDPDYVHELMKFCTQVSISFGEALLDIKASPNYSEAPASCSLISPKMYRTFVLPYHKQIVSHFRERKASVGFHICGYVDPILADMVSTGATNLSIDAPTDLAKAVEAARGKAVLIGNVNTQLFYGGTKEEMRMAIQRCIDLAPHDSGYVLASGCEVPGIAPPEKVEWFMELAAELGRYGATPHK
jgi:uroporphyrinogen decarboxylase